MLLLVGQPRSLRRRVWFATLAAVLGTLLVGLIAETIGQLYGRRHPVRDVLAWQADPDLGWRLVPDLAFTWAGLEGWYAREFEVEVQVNAHGFRDLPRALDRPAGVERVALLGDSFFEGLQVPLQATCAQVLEGRLRVRHPEVEVLNLGISSHGVGQSLLAYERVARRFGARHVAVLVTELTLSRTPLGEERGGFTGGRALAVRPWFSRDAEERLVRHPARDTATLVEVQAALVKDDFAGQRVRLRPPGWFLPGRLRAAWDDLTRGEELGSPYPAIDAETWWVNRLVLLELARAARADGAKLLVVDGLTHLNPGAHALSEQVRGLCAEEELVHVDASAALRAAEARGQVTRWRRDGHWTAAGHEAVAGALDEALRRSGL